MTDLLTARPNRETGDVLLLVNGDPFARLVGLDAGEWVFVPLCYVGEGMRDLLDLTGLDRLSEYLAEIRRAYDADYERRYLEANDDEAAWLREDAPVNEYDPEAEADLELHNALHPDGYGH